MSIFFTADTHFGHLNLTKAAKKPKPTGIRPFANVEEHDETLVKRWNAQVQPNDTVYHLGDVCWGSSKARNKFEILQRLNGKIHLIRGNHDQDIKATDMGMMGRFETIRDLATIKHNGRKIVLCHYPLTAWDSSSRGSMHLHGHCHGDLAPDPDRLRYDVGVDVWDFAPVHVEAVFALMDEKALIINERAIERSQIELLDQQQRHA